LVSVDAVGKETAYVRIAFGYAAVYKSVKFATLALHHQTFFYFFSERSNFAL
jgi:hypothetical protein